MTASSRERSEQILRSCLCLAVRKASRAVSSGYDEILAPAGISSGQFTLLAQIKLGVVVHTTVLAARLAIERTTLSRNLQLLDTRGLIAFRADEADKRKKMVALTGDGQRQLAIALPYWMRAQTSLHDVLSVRGWSESIEIVNGLVNSLRKTKSSPRRPRRATAALLTDEQGYLPGYLTREQLDYLRENICLCTILRRCVRALSAHFDGGLREAGLEISQLHILAAIDARPGSRISDLVDVLTLDQTTLTRMLQRMVSLDLIAKSKSYGQGRSFELTGSAKCTLQSGISAWHDRHAELQVILTKRREAGVRTVMATLLSAALTFNQPPAEKEVVELV